MPTLPETKNYILTDIFLSEPVGSSAPKFSGSDYLSGTKKHDGSPFSLSCPAQGFPAPSFRSATDCLDMLLNTVQDTVMRWWEESICEEELQAFYIGKQSITIIACVF